VIGGAPTVQLGNILAAQIEVGDAVNVTTEQVALSDTDQGAQGKFRAGSAKVIGMPLRVTVSAGST